jgi:hypothetical protein
VRGRAYTYPTASVFVKLLVRERAASASVGTGAERRALARAACSGGADQSGWAATGDRRRAPVATISSPRSPGSAASAKARYP